MVYRREVVDRLLSRPARFYRELRLSLKERLQDVQFQYRVHAYQTDVLTGGLLAPTTQDMTKRVARKAYTLCIP